jgi:acyl-CoA thioesterase
MNTQPCDGDPDERARNAVQALYAGDAASKRLGIEILEVAPGRVRIAMIVRPDMVNGHGICHGGLLFTMADSAFAFACNSHGVAMVAAGAAIEFLAPAPLGERLIADAVETFRTDRHGIYDIAISNSGGAQFAHFRGRCARLRLPGQPAGGPPSSPKDAP